jgi:hypothetical protein
VFQNIVLRRILGQKDGENDEELHILYSIPNIIKSINSNNVRWTGHVACIGEMKNSYEVLVGKPERKRPLGTSRRRWSIILIWIL